MGCHSQITCCFKNLKPEKHKIHNILLLFGISLYLINWFPLSYIEQLICPRDIGTFNLRLGGFTASETVEENVNRVFDLFPILQPRGKDVAGYLSGGEQQMLAIGRALMSNPSYLLLDEPSLGLAPKLVEQIAELIKEINSQGVTVLLVEQNANMALKISDHGYIMETGNVVMDNPSEKLLADQDVREFYLGLNSEGTDRKSFKDVKHYKRKKRWLSWVH